MTDQHVPGAAIAAAAAAIVLLVAAARKRGKGRLPDGGKDDDLIAARALETVQPNALYQDPLAETLAGEEAMVYARNTSMGVNPKEDFPDQATFMGTLPDASGAGAHRLGTFHIRTKFLDDALLRFLLPDPGSPAKTATQVVLLGAGMDTRAWRLQTPPGVRWFEVDRPGVLTVKHRLLARSGAELPRDSLSGGAPRFPLLAASYAAVAGDLADGTWASELRAAGWDAVAPTVFLAEGLTRYLKPEVLEAMFRTAAQEAAPGSTFIATMSSQEEVDEWRSKPKTLGGVNEHVYWGYPNDPAEMRAYFERLGWYQTGGETARSCGREVVGPRRQLSFDDTVKGTGHSYMFWIAHNVRA